MMKEKELLAKENQGEEKVAETSNPSQKSKEFHKIHEDEDIILERLQVDKDAPVLTGKELKDTIKEFATKMAGVPMMLVALDENEAFGIMGRENEADSRMVGSEALNKALVSFFMKNKEAYITVMMSLFNAMTNDERCAESFCKVLNKVMAAPYLDPETPEPVKNLAHFISEKLVATFSPIFAEKVEREPEPIRKTYPFHPKKINPDDLN